MARSEPCYEREQQDTGLQWAGYEVESSTEDQADPRTGRSNQSGHQLHHSRDDETTGRAILCLQLSNSSVTLLEAIVPVLQNGALSTFDKNAERTGRAQVTKRQAAASGRYAGERMSVAEGNSPKSDLYSPANRPNCQKP